MKNTVLNKPMISMDANIIKENNETIIIMIKNNIIRIKGKNLSLFFDTILNLLNGQNTIEEIIRKTHNLMPKESLLKLLDTLQDFYLIEEADSDRFSKDQIIQYYAPLGYYSRWGKDKFDILKTINSKKVCIIGLNNLAFKVSKLISTIGIGEIILIDDTAVLTEDIGNEFYLKDIGKSRAEVVNNQLRLMNPLCKTKIARSNKIEDMIDYADLSIVLATFDFENFLWPKEVNKISLLKRTPWIYGAVQKNGEGIVGPLFIPFETACYECMTIRIKSNSCMFEELEMYERRIREHDTVDSKIFFQPHIDIIAGVIVNEIWAYFSELSHVNIINQFYLFDMKKLSLEPHYILKVPRCSFCSRITMKPIQKIWNDDIIEINRMLID